MPLQRKRKKVVYNRDFIGAIGIDKHTEGITTDHRLIISHYSCVEKLTKMYTPVTAGATTTNSPSPTANTISFSNSQNYANGGHHSDNIVHTISESSTEISDKSDASTFDERNVNYCYVGDNEEQRNTSRMVTERSDCDDFEFKLADSDRNRSIANNSPISDEGCLIGISPYSSSGEDDEYSRRKPLIHEKVERSSSSDSALGLDEELTLGATDTPSPVNSQRRMTLTVTDIPLRPALLPVAEPTSLPESPTALCQQQSEWYSNNPPVVIPSKMILEARIVEIPPPPPVTDAGVKFSSFNLGRMSRRESSQSYVSDIAGNDDSAHIRYVRTPSVVVSDYSDDVVCGITLEELEFFRSQRKSSLGASVEYSSNTLGESTDDYPSDLSAASSCSNLCGSTISILDDHYMSLPGTPDRKDSDCSVCSALSADDEESFSSSLIQALNQQKKKVCIHKQPNYNLVSK